MFSGNAGDYTISCKQPADACPSYDGSISFGYDSDYIWRGMQFADESIWGDINYTFGDLTVGIWVLKALPGDARFGDEVDLYASYALPSFLGFDAEVGYTNYRIDQINGVSQNDSHEFYLALSREVAPLNATVAYSFAHDITLETTYQELTLNRTIPLAGLDLDLTSGIGYWSGQAFSGQSGASHTFSVLSTTFDVNCQLSLTPYVGYTNSLPGGPSHPNAMGGRFSQGGGSAGDQFYGGVSASWAF